MSGSGGSGPLILQLGAEFASGSAAALAAATKATQDYGSAADIAAAQDSNLADVAVAAATRVVAAKRNSIAAADDLTKAETAAARASSLLAAAQAQLATAQATSSPAVASLQRSVDNLTLANTKTAEALAVVQQKYGLLPAAAGAVTQSVNGMTGALNTSTAGVINAQKAAVEHTASLGQQQFASRQLTVQFSQMFSGILSGQPVLQTFIQQGHQIIDVAASTGTSLTSALGGAIKSIGGLLIGPTGIVIGLAATAAGLVYMGVTADSTATKIAKLSAQLSLTQSNSAALAKMIESLPTAQQAGATSIAGDQNFAGDTTALQSYIGLIKQLTQTYGDFAAQSAKVKAAVDDPAKAAQDAVNNGWKGFNEILALTIKSEQDSGNYTQALRDYMTALQASASNTQVALSPLAKAFHDLGSELSGVKTAGESFTEWVGNAMDSALTNWVEKLAQAAHYVGSLKALLENPGAGAPVITTGTGTTVVTGAPVYGGSNITNGGVLAPGAGQAAQYAAAGIQMPTTTGAQLAQQTGTILASLDTLIRTETARLGSAGLSGNDPTTIANIASRVSINESSGGRNPASVYSSSGTQHRLLSTGALQVSPAVGQDTGFNISTPQGNVDAGVSDIAKLYTKYNGDVSLTVMAYNWGPTWVDDFLAGTLALPPSVASYANKITGANMSVAQYTAKYAGSTADTFTSGDSTGGFMAQGATPNNLTSTGLLKSAYNSDTAKTMSDASNTIAQGQAISDAIKKNIADTAQAVKDETGLSGDALTKQQSIVNAYGQELIKLYGQQATNLTAQQKDLQATNDSTKGYSDLGAAADQAAKTTAEYAEKARDSGDATMVTTNLEAALNAQQTIRDRAFAQSIQNINDQTTATQALTNSFDGNVVSAQHTADAQKALADVKAYDDPRSAKYIQDVNTETAALDANASATRARQAQQEAYNESQNLSGLQEQISLLGESTAAQEKDLAVYQERMKLQNEGISESDPTYQARLQVAASTATTQQSLTDLKNDITSFQSIGTTAFSSVGQAITNAFVNGTSAGVSFGTTMKGILAQILIQLGELLVLDPILNSLTGSNSNATLSGYLSAIGGGSSSGGNGLLNVIGVAGSAAGVAGSALGLGGQGGGVTTSGAGGTTTTGAGSTLSTSSGVISNLTSLYSIGKGIYSGLSGGTFSTGFPVIDSVLNFDTGIGAAAGQGVGAGGFAGSGAATAGAGASFGSLIGGAGAGFALGTLLNDYVFKGNQTNGEIGAGVGAATGAVVGAAAAGAFTLGIAAPVGALIGGLIGGVVGGGGGGLIGPALPNYGYEVTEGATSNGLLGILKSGGEGDPGGQAAQALAKQVSTYNDSFNQILAQAGITVSGSTILGANNYSKAGKGDAASGNAGKETTDLNSIFQNLSFSSSNSVLNSALTNPLTKPQNITQLSAISDAFADLSKNLGTLLNPLTGTNDAIGTYGTQLATLNANYATGIQEARTLGLSTKSLTDAQAEAQQQLQASAQATINNTLAGFAVRDLTATGQTNQAALLQQQVSAQEETASFSASLISLYGTNFKNTSEYASDMALLSKTQQDESNALQAQQAAAAQAAAAQAAAAAQQNRDAATQTITGIYASYTAFLKTLQTSTQSPMSPQAALAAARSTFAQDAAASAAGNSTAFANLQGDATNLLSASRVVNGSGAGYVADYNAVVNAGGIASGDVGIALTNDAMAKIAQTQTDQFVAAIQGLQQTMAQIRVELQQGNART